MQVVPRVALTRAGAVSAGAAIVVRDQEISGSRLARELNKLTPEVLAAMSRKARQLGKPDAARRTVELLESVCK